MDIPKSSLPRKSRQKVAKATLLAKKPKISHRNAISPSRLHTRANDKLHQSNQKQTSKKQTKAHSKSPIPKSLTPYPSKKSRSNAATPKLKMGDVSDIIKPRPNKDPSEKTNRSTR